MVEQKKKTFPVMPVRNWWELRKRFIQTIPTAVTSEYVALTLDMTEKSASYNVLPGLRQTKIVNEDGQVNQDRVRRWRDNKQYADVCEEIRKELYPPELLDLFPKPTEADRDAVSQWFANRTGLGTVAVGKMVAFYLLLSEADAAKMTETAKPKPEKPKRKPKQEQVNKIKEKQEISETKTRPTTEGELNIPSININVQVHISSDASVTQIDQIFASMAKHLNVRRKTGDE